MTNTKVDQQLIRTRLSRLDGLTAPQITALAQVLNPLVLATINDASLALTVSATLPTLPLNPDQGLPLGLPGAVANARFVGGTTLGAPTVGTFQAGDYVVSQGDGSFYLCLADGSPGSWVQSGSGGGSGGGGLPLGLPGATVGTRFVGGTTSGAPTTGSFRAGDFVVTLDGTIWICVTAGTPGSWDQVTGSGGSSGISTLDPLFGAPGGVSTLDGGGIVVEPPAAHTHATYFSGIQAEGAPVGFQPILNILGMPAVPDPSNGRINVGAEPITVITAKATVDFPKTGTSSGASLSTWTDLTSPLLGNGGLWIFDGFIVIYSDQAAQAAILPAGPAGSEFFCLVGPMLILTATSESGGYKQKTFATPTGNSAASIGGFPSGGAIVGCRVTGVAVGGSTAGSVTWSFAQQAATAQTTPTAGKKRSSVTYTRLA